MKNLTRGTNDRITWQETPTAVNLSSRLVQKNEKSMDHPSILQLCFDLITIITIIQTVHASVSTNSTDKESEWEKKTYTKNIWNTCLKKKNIYHKMFLFISSFNHWDFTFSWSLYTTYQPLSRLYAGEKNNWKNNNFLFNCWYFLRGKIQQ